MIVACTTDRRFVQLASVMLASLFDKGEIGDDWRVIVFGYLLRACDKAKLRASCGADSGRLEFIDIDPATEALAGLLPTTFALNPSPYLRILIPALLGDAHGRALYLDSDTLILGSLRPLAEMALHGNPIAAAEANDYHPSLDGRLPLPAECDYFNSGVILIDLEAWRREDLTTRIMAFAQENTERMSFPDQDALNCVIRGRFTPLQPKWNLTRPDAERGCADPHIVHFTGTKPWSAACRHPAREAFLRYRRQTPWRHKRLTSRFETRMARSIKKRRVALHRLWAGLFGARPEAGS